MILYDLYDYYYDNALSMTYDSKTCAREIDISKKLALHWNIS